MDPSSVCSGGSRISGKGAVPLPEKFSKFAPETAILVIVSNNPT